MNPNARTKPTELACSREEASRSHGTRLIKYKLEPRIPSAGGRSEENNALDKDGERNEETINFFQYSPPLYSDVNDSR